MRDGRSKNWRRKALDAWVALSGAERKLYRDADRVMEELPFENAPAGSHITFEDWCRRSGLPYPLSLLGSPEARELLDRVCPPL